MMVTIVATFLGLLPIRRQWAELKRSQWQTLHVTCRLWSGMYRLEALASRLIIEMASRLMVKLLVVVVVVVV